MSPMYTQHMERRRLLSRPIAGAVDSVSDTMDREIWSMIRETRSARPGKAHEDAKRGAVYGAALQQFEELMRAAATAGNASRPLPLFYAVSQAGRAIAAAWADGPWTREGHGLKHSMGRSALRSTVKPDPGPEDSFSHVAAVTGNHGLTKPVELGALWASLPDLWRYELSDERWKRPLRVLRKTEDIEGRYRRGPYIGGTIVFLEERSVSRALLDFDDGNGPGFLEALDAELKHYPTASEWVPLRHANLSLDRRTWDGWQVEVAWETVDSTVAAREEEFQAHVHEHRIRGEGGSGRTSTRPETSCGH